MLLIRIIQKLVRTLNSDGTPGQVALGIALGSAFGLTPIANLHNLVILAVVFVFNVSFPAAMLGWIFFAPVGFLLDPVFNAVGSSLLTNIPLLFPTWITFYNTPVLPFSNYNNTVVLGSLVGWVVLAVPIFFLARMGVTRYREKVLSKLERTKVFKAVKASKVYNVYRLFRPD
jgi:uncharacterized protein (TIGR03546 family)